ncbi:asparagine synthase-related protein [Lacimicrobium alkaliphilum]|uniref:Asparagine synthetase domain-containing protein n=1 Tax=Lacimicrobium alkaliphilum TaxID=1526571 RepID=A0A0U2RKU0_9ALTE|nr:asparagine synthase-related protein [Lacimicrobium alkaliphilum]ALS97898.1 hypothetical protein AT746_06200 [Lacimicrobium alkaliphilum]
MGKVAELKKTGRMLVSGRMTDVALGNFMALHQRIIPSQVIDRPKGYFPVPALRQMQGEYLNLARDVFSQQVARQRNLFDMAYIDQMLASPQDFTGPFGSRLWQVTLLELWLQELGIHH